MTGRAIVVLREGRQYEGACRFAHGCVHCEDARRRVSFGDWVKYNEVGSRSWPRSQVREIRWLSRSVEERA